MHTSPRHMSPVGPERRAIERSRNVTFVVVEQYVAGLGDELELSVVTAGETIPLMNRRGRKPSTRGTAQRPRAGNTA